MDSLIDVPISLLVHRGKSTPVGITYLVEPRHKKTDNPFYNSFAKRWLIEKVGEMVGFVGVDYESSVNNQRAREEIETDFHSQPLWKGKGVHLNRFLAEHIDTHKRYLKVLPNSKQNEDEYTVRAKVQYRWIATQKPLTEKELETLAQFEPTKSVSSTQQTERPVFWQTIALDSIVQLRFAGECYEIRKI